MKTIFALILPFLQGRNGRDRDHSNFLFRQLLLVYLFVGLRIIHYRKTDFKMKNITEVFYSKKLHFVEKLSLIKNTTRRLFLSVKENLIIASGDCLSFNNSQLNFLST
jgi:hypothetical protein